MITGAAMTKLTSSFAATLTQITYDLDGISATATGFQAIVSGSTIRAISTLAAGLGGVVSNIKLHDSDGVIVAISAKNFVKLQGKKQYIAFAFTLQERGTF